MLHTSGRSSGSNCWITSNRNLKNCSNAILSKWKAERVGSRVKPCCEWIGCSRCSTCLSTQASDDWKLGVSSKFTANGSLRVAIHHIANRDLRQNSILLKSALSLVVMPVLQQASAKHFLLSGNQFPA